MNVITKIILKIKLETMMTPTMRMAPIMTESYGNTRIGIKPIVTVKVTMTMIMMTIHVVHTIHDVCIVKNANVTTMMSAMTVIVVNHPKRNNKVAMAVIVAMTVIVVMIIKNLIVHMVTITAGVHVVTITAGVHIVIMIMNHQMMMMELLKIMNRLMMTEHTNCPLVMIVTMMMKAVSLAMI